MRSSTPLPGLASLVLVRLLALLALLVFFAPAARAVPVPRFSGYVVDEANIIDAQSRAQITAIASQLDHAGIAQLAVCTVSDLGDESKEEFAVDVFKAWGLGHGKQRSDGVLLLLVPGAPGHRKIKVEVGYGMEGVLPDGKVGALIREQAVPRMQQNQYGPAAAAMIAALAQVINADAAQGGDSAPKADGMRGGAGVGQSLPASQAQPVPRDQSGQPGQPDQTGAPSAADSTDGAPGVWLAVIAMGALLIVLLSSATRRQFPGTRTGIIALALAAATAIGLFILGGAIGWVVFVAGAIANGFAWSSIRSHKCPKCGGWLVVSQRLISAPTLFSEGLAETLEQCTHCDYRAQRTKRLARKSPVVTSGWGGGGGGWGGGGGGDSGGGFSGGGGGESGGGGAGADV